MISQKECKSVERLTLHLDLAKFFLSCSETVAWMFRSLCFPVIQQCSRAFLVEYSVQGESKSEKNKQSTMARKVKVLFEKIFCSRRLSHHLIKSRINVSYGISFYLFCSFLFRLGLETVLEPPRIHLKPSIMMTL